jgi:hypothetical protein
MVDMMGCDNIATALEVHGGMQAIIIRRPVGTFPDLGTVGTFSSMGVGEVVVVCADGTGDMLALILVGLSLDVIGVGHWKVLHISHFRRDTCGKNDGQNTYPSHHADGIEGANLKGPTGEG